MTITRTPAPVLFPELADPPADYELSLWLRFHFNDYREVPNGDYLPVVCGDYVLACGRECGRWRLRVVPKIGVDEDGEDELGPAVLDARDQVAGADPLALLRALLSGGSAGCTRSRVESARDGEPSAVLSGTATAFGATRARRNG